MRAGAVTDPGRVRPANEDSVYADAGAGILIVADGMGGHAAGEVASDIAVTMIARILSEELPPGGVETGVISSLLESAVEQASAAIRTRAAGDPSLHGMGTTVVAAVVRGEQISLAHVGDSRAYLIHEGQIRRLTHDHSLVADLVRAGQITPSQARKHHLRNVITRSLGFEVSARPDFQAVGWEPGDWLVLCSDGLTNMLEDDEIASAAGSADTDPEAVCRRMIALANERGGTDNISVVAALNA
jgi:serine/threonine protein phosphatase PrpC